MQPTVAPDWVDSLRWQFLPLLGQQTGIRVDTRAHLNVEIWLDKALSQGWLTQDPASARGAVRAILCKSAREQSAFDASFDTWMQGWNDPAQQLVGAAPVGDGSQRGRTSDLAPPGTDKPLLQRWLLGLALTLPLAALLVGLWLWRERTLAAEAAAAAAAQAASAASAVAAVVTADLGTVVMKLEVQLPAAAAAAVSPASAAPLPTPGPATPPWLFGIHPGFFAVLVLVAASVGILERRTRQKFVQRITTRENLREQEVFARQLLPVSGKRREGLRRAVRLLRQPDTSPQQDLDIAASVRASAANAGLFKAVQRPRTATPEYLFLVDRLRQGDQQAHWAIETARDLAAEGVRLSLYEFDHDPRWVAPLRNQRSSRTAMAQRYVPLATLAAQHGGQGLLILGDGHGLLDKAKGTLVPWLQHALLPWPRRVLITPRPMASWDAAEDLLAGDQQPPHQPSFLVVPSQLDAWLAAARWLRRSEVLDVGMLPGAPAELPPPLAEDPARWLSRSAPEAAELVLLVEQLRAYLGPAAYTWLAASAAYPLLSAELTAYLAHQLPDAATPDAPGAPAPIPDPRLLEARLVAIAQLPWCRHGLMPDWLRRALLISLPQATRRQVREVMRQLFRTAGDATVADAGWSLGPVATDQAAGSHGARQPFWREWARRIGLAGVLEDEPADSPLRDAIYLGVLRGEFDQELSLEATEEFARAASAHDFQRLSWNPLRWVAAGILSLWFALRWFHWRVKAATDSLIARFSDVLRPSTRLVPDSGPAGVKPAAAGPLEAQVPPAAALNREANSTSGASRPKVYVSYQRTEIAFVQALIGGLQHALNIELVLDVELDQDGVAAALRRAIESASLMIAFIGPGWDEQLGSFNHAEVQAGLAAGIPILPVLIRGAGNLDFSHLPSAMQTLSSHQFIQLRDKNSEHDRLRLYLALTQMLDSGHAKASPGNQGSK